MTCDMQTPEFQEFFDKNKNWLEPYALFCVLRKLFGTTEHWRWGTLSTPTPDVRLPIALSPALSLMLQQLPPEKRCLRAHNAPLLI